MIASASEEAPNTAGKVSKVSSRGSAASLSLVLSCTLRRTAGPRGRAPLATGAYSLYLSQKIAYHAVAHFAPQAGLENYARLVAALAAALALGALLYWTVERPFLRLRDRLEGSSRSSIAVAGEPAA